MSENNVRRPEETEDVARARAAVRRTVTRRKTNRLRLNLFDFLIIFVILLVVALLAMGISLSDVLGVGEKGEPVKLSYALTLTGVEEQYAQSIKNGDALYDVATKAAIGTVSQAPTVTPHQEAVLVTAADGTSSLVMKQTPGRVDVVLLVTAEALYTEGQGYTVSGTPIRVGSSYALRTVGYTAQAQCTAFHGAVKLQSKEVTR